MVIARRERRVEWGDCDPARIVFNPRFFEWFDGQTAAIFELAGLPKRDLMQRPDFAGFPLVETQAKFLRPSRFWRPCDHGIDDRGDPPIELRRPASPVQ